MNSIRYYVALLVLMTLPPAIILWYFIHPFARFWRKLGPVWTYVVLSLPTAALMAIVYLFRKQLLVVEYGTSISLFVISAACALGAVVIQTKRRRYLTKAILSGIPELSKKGEPGMLLTDGIYGELRHPRYVEVLLFVLAYSFFSNYLAVYVAAVLTVPTLYLVVVLEERELHERFGSAYEEYCARVPRFLPCWPKNRWSHGG